MESSSFSGSSKRAKAPGHIPHVTHCSVDGCIADLSLCRDYHRRHKVCEIHSKTPTVIVGGREQRFCQQCSRFHSLVEFDEGKRSCRKRLDGHNRRRRKPQSDFLSRNSGYLFSCEEGGRLLSFGGSQILPNAVVNSSWSGIAKSKNSATLCNKQQPRDYTECSSESYKRVNQPQFMQTISDHSFQEAALVDHPNAALNQADRALSLLSSASTLSRERALTHLFKTKLSPPHPHSAAHNWPCNNGLGQLEIAPGSRSFLSESYGCPASNAVHFLEMFQQGSEGPSTDSTTPNHGLTFTWE